MSIVDVRPVVAPSYKVPVTMSQQLAQAISRVLKAPPGRVWVRLEEIPDTNYAENALSVENDNLPIFVHVLHADWPEGSVRVEEARALAIAVAACFGRATERVHIEYAPPGRGRIAFGGELLE